MTDMLVKLYELEIDWPGITAQQQAGIVFRKPLGSEKHRITTWVGQHFSAGWASEADIAISQRPPTCFLAVAEQQILGFACYDAAALGLFGPMGVDPTRRNQGIGKALLHLTLLDMQWRGYGYAVIGSVGPAEFYAKTVAAIAIPNSSPGLWRTCLKAGP